MYPVLVIKTSKTAIKNTNSEAMGFYSVFYSYIYFSHLRPINFTGYIPMHSSAGMLISLNFDSPDNLTSLECFFVFSHPAYKIKGQRTSQQTNNATMGLDEDSKVS